MPKFLILSDLHLGAHPGVHHDEVGEQAASVIKEHRLGKSADVVVLNGDILDNWAHPIDSPPPTWADILDGEDVDALLAELTNWKKSNVWYLRGNHDFDSPSIPKLWTEYNAGTAYKKLWFEHGHRMDLFNAPDPTGREYPFGYFITRVHTQGLHTKAPNLKNAHHYFDGFGRINEKVAGAAIADPLRGVSLVEIVMGAVALDAGVAMTDRIPMPNGSAPTVQEVTNIYRNLFNEWMKKVGYQTAMQMLLVSAEQMIWEAQEVLKGAKKRILAMGHSHKPDYRFFENLGGYVNDGAMCISDPTWSRIDYPAKGPDAVCIEQYRWSHSIDEPFTTTWITQK